MYLCEVAVVSQLCISFPYVLHGLCEDYLTCDIAFNAVMPLSRASSRGRYSRIEGVTAFHPYSTQVKLVLACCILHSWILYRRFDETVREEEDVEPDHVVSSDHDVEAFDNNAWKNKRLEWTEQCSLTEISAWFEEEEEEEATAAAAEAEEEEDLVAATPMNYPLFSQ